MTTSTDDLSTGPLRGLPALATANGVAAARRVAGREPVLTAVAVLAAAVALVCFVGVAVKGTHVPPEGKMADAVTFCAGVAVFTLTMAWLLPLAGYSPAARRRWRCGYCLFAVYGVLVESVQAFRGRDPRFSEVGGAVDSVTGIVFGTTALVLTVLFFVLGMRFFRQDVLANRPIVRAGIRFGVVSVNLSFAVGVLMSVTNGSTIGDGGDVLLAHALSIHGIQTIPAVAVPASASSPAASRAPVVHAAGTGWLVACVATLCQALRARPPFEWSLLNVVAVAGLAVWAASAATALLRWQRTRNKQHSTDPALDHTTRRHPPAASAHQSRGPKSRTRSLPRHLLSSLTRPKHRGGGSSETGTA